MKFRVRPDARLYFGYFFRKSHSPWRSPWIAFFFSKRYHKSYLNYSMAIRLFSCQNAQSRLHVFAFGDSNFIFFWTWYHVCVMIFKISEIWIILVQKKPKIFISHSEFAYSSGSWFLIGRRNQIHILKLLKKTHAGRIQDSPSRGANIWFCQIFRKIAWNWEIF